MEREGKEEEDDEKRRKMCYVHGTVPHDEDNYYRLQKVLIK